MNKRLVKSLAKAINQRVPEIHINLINCGTSGKTLIKMLEEAGYVSDAPGHPQQIFTLSY